MSDHERGAFAPDAADALQDELVDIESVDLGIALSLSLKVPASTLAETLRRIEAGDADALSLYPDGTTVETIRYVLENRTVVDAEAYANGVANGIDEVAFELGLPFHGAIGDHYSIEQIKDHVLQSTNGKPREDCPSAEIASLKGGQVIPKHLGGSHAAWKRG